MSKAKTLSIISAFSFAVILIGISAGASTLNAKAILAKALADGARQSNVTVSGSVVDSGVTVTLNGGFSSVSDGGATTVSGVGTNYQITKVGAAQCFVKATTLTALKQALSVKSPVVSEIGVWYVVKKIDSRYQSICSPGGAQTVAQTFSFSPIGWSKKATYEGIVTLKGVRTIKLLAASNLFVDGSGFQKTTLYVTDTAKPLPFAITGPVGSTGLLYFTKWSSTIISIPTTSTELPK
jgi:hypothetical protein